jgi:ketosteroid isomerase-like protein
MSRLAPLLLLCTAGAFTSVRAHAQAIPTTTTQNGSQPTGQSLPAATPSQPAPAHVFIPMTVPKITPGQLELLKLEGDFSDAVTAGGGKAFSSWFAEDGVTLNNGKPAVLGRTAIAAIANWDPAQYKLSWYAEGAQMGPSNETGFTWGHYDATTTDKDGKATTLSGRYITFWKKVDGKWKVALDASADEPPPTNGLPTP